MSMRYALASLSIIVLPLAAACSAPVPTTAPLQPTVTLPESTPEAASRHGPWLGFDKANSQLPEDTVRALAPDQKGGIWVGTYTGGLAHFDGKTWTLYDSENSGLPGDYVSTLAIDPNGTLWVGTCGAGLAHFDGQEWTVYDTQNSGLPSNEVQSIVFDAQGAMWVGTAYRGLARYEGVEWPAGDPSSRKRIRGPLGGAPIRPQLTDQNARSGRTVGSPSERRPKPGEACPAPRPGT